MNVLNETEKQVRAAYLDNPGTVKTTKTPEGALKFEYTGGPVFQVSREVHMHFTDLASTSDFPWQVVPLFYDPYMTTWFFLNNGLKPNHRTTPQSDAKPKSVRPPAPPPSAPPPSGTMYKGG